MRETEMSFTGSFLIWELFFDYRIRLKKVQGKKKKMIQESEELNQAYFASLAEGKSQIQNI
jgi:hypothetical protein